MKLESTLKILEKVNAATEKMIQESQNRGYSDSDITNTELSCIKAFLGDIAMSLAIIADHYTDMKKGN